MVSDCAALTMLVTASVTCQVAVRVALAPPLVGSAAPEENITLSSTAL